MLCDAMELHIGDDKVKRVMDNNSNNNNNNNNTFRIMLSRDNTEMMG